MQNLGLLWGVESSYRNDLGFERNKMAANSLGLCRWANNVLRFLKCPFHRKVFSSFVMDADLDPQTES